MELRDYDGIKVRYSESAINEPFDVFNFLEEAEDLFQVRKVEWLHLEKLKGEIHGYKGLWSVRVGNTKYRLISYPYSRDGEDIIKGDVFALPYGIRAIRVIIGEDYH